MYSLGLGRLFGIDKKTLYVEEIRKDPSNSSTVEDVNQIDPEATRLKSWLRENYHKPLRDTRTKIVVKTGTDFLTNQPLLELIPGRREYKEPKRKQRQQLYEKNTPNAEEIQVSYENSTRFYLFQRNPKWEESLLEKGEIYIGSSEHLGNGTGPRGADLAKDIAQSIKQFCRERLGLPSPDVETRNAGGKNRRVVISQEILTLYREYKEYIPKTSQQYTMI